MDGGGDGARDRRALLAEFESYHARSLEVVVVEDDNDMKMTTTTMTTTGMIRMAGRRRLDRKEEEG
jgi:hypothetical protein